MRAPRRLLALGTVLAVFVAVGSSVVACKTKGNGIGTAPGDNDKCPTLAPNAGDPCTTADKTAPRLCPYGPEAGPPSSYAYCPGGVGATWEIVTPSDGGYVADSGHDAGDADGEVSDGDAGDALDGEVALDGDATSDDADATDATDAAEVIDAPDALDADADDGDVADAPDASDAD